MFYKIFNIFILILIQYKNHFKTVKKNENILTVLLHKKIKSLLFNYKRFFTNTKFWGNSFLPKSFCKTKVFPFYFYDSEEELSDESELDEEELEFRLRRFDFDFFSLITS